MSSLKNWVAVLILAGAFFAFLGSRGLNEPDEGRYAEIAREMLISGDWLTPHLNGFEHFQKPPLLYLVTAVSFSIFGLNEWAARIPSTLAALGIVAMTAWMASTLFGRKSAWPTALILSSSFLFFALARFLTPDMLMSFFIVAALACVVKNSFGKSPSAFWRWGFFLAMGLGFMTKGPMAFVVPISAAIFFRQGVRPTLPSPSLPWLRGMFLALAVGFFWFGVMAYIHPPLLRYFLDYELLQRFGSHTHGRSHPFWYFLPVIALGFLPWVIFVPRMAMRLLEKIRAKRSFTAAQWLLLGWIIPPFLILSCSGSKLLTYVLPLLPAFSLGMVHGWQQQKYSLVALNKIAVVSMLFLLLVFSQADRWNDLFSRQASIRSLAMSILQRPDGRGIPVFSAGIRLHSLEFYLGRPVSVCQSDADLVCSVPPLEQGRLFQSLTAARDQMALKPNSLGVVRQVDFNSAFQSRGWEIMGRAGDFVLIHLKKSSSADQAL